jgi:predicted acetyltransferase
VTSAASHDVHVLDQDRLRAAHTLFGAAIHRGPSSDERWARVVDTYVPGRTLGVLVDGALAGTTTSFPTSTAVPGGAALPTAAVTRVGVRADRTRRGVLTALMHRQLADAAAAGEVLAILGATEAGIYGRFGYGIATRGRRLRVRRRAGGGWRAGAAGGGTVRALDPDEILKVVVPLHRRIALTRPGGILRPDPWWSLGVAEQLHERAPVVAAVHTGPDGEDGFVLATPEQQHDSDHFAFALTVQDLQAADLDAAAALWRYLLDVDLVDTVLAVPRPLDEPVELLLADPRDCTTTDVEDELWLRIVDVPAALAARGYRPAEPVLLGVRDTVLAANSGVYRIADGTARRVGDLDGPVAAELECDPTGLAMAYLGDRTPSTLVATGWWRAADPRAVAAADAAFATAASPWCGTYF